MTHPARVGCDLKPAGSDRSEPFRGRRFHCPIPKPSPKWQLPICVGGSSSSVWHRVNYIDRQCLSVAAPTIARSSDSRNADYASIVIVSWPRTPLCSLSPGQIVDRIGVRWGMALFAGLVVAWPDAARLCSGLWSFRPCRFCSAWARPATGRRPPKPFPNGSPHASAAWRWPSSTADRVGWRGGAPLVAWLILCFGWQVAFLATGALAMLWLLFGCGFIARPKSTMDYRNRVAAHSRQTGRRSRRPAVPQPWHWLLACRQAWGIVLGRLLTDCVWWFYVYWLRKYLADQRGFSLDESRLRLGFRSLRRIWATSAAADFQLSVATRLDAQCRPQDGAGPRRHRNAGWCAGRALPITRVMLSLDQRWPRSRIAAWGTMMLTLPTDLFPSRQTGSVSGMSGTGAGLGGMAFTWLIGYVVDRYPPIRRSSMAAGLMPHRCLVVVQLLVPKISAARRPSGEPMNRYRPHPLLRNPMLPVEIVLAPGWWHRHAGITFDEDYFFHPAKRVEAERKMEQTLFERWGRFGLAPTTTRRCRSSGRCIWPPVFCFRKCSAAGGVRCRWPAGGQAGQPRKPGTFARGRLREAPRTAVGTPSAMLCARSTAGWWATWTSTAC